MLTTAPAPGRCAPAPRAAARRARPSRSQVRAAATPDAAAPLPSRRAALAGLASTLALVATAPAARAEEEAAPVAVADAPAPAPAPPSQPPLDASFSRLSDRTLSYAFDYPTTVAGTPLPLVPSRKPERYSSAAPLSADARQRIVCELIALAQGVTVSVTVGPAAGVLKGKDPATWTPAQVAATVLADRSTARVTGGQRVSLNAIESASRSSRGPASGGDFFVYEHLSQGSPSNRSYDGARETYRHAWACTGVRAGKGGEPYLYTLNLSCPQDLWARLGPAFEASAASFELPPPGEGYVPPDAQPWRFF